MTEEQAVYQAVMQGRAVADVLDTDQMELPNLDEPVKAAQLFESDVIIIAELDLLRRFKIKLTDYRLHRRVMHLANAIRRAQHKARAKRKTKRRAGSIGSSRRAKPTLAACPPNPRCTTLSERSH